MLIVQSRVLSTGEIKRLREAAFTYAEVGATRDGTQPSGSTSVRRTRTIGVGRERFEQASRILLGWDMHRRAGAGVRASDDHVVLGAVAVVRLGVGVAAINAPVRVVYVTDEPRRRGFAYGTLPGHPVSGEEAFILELGEDNTVTFTITAFSRPTTRLARMGGPVGRGAQSWVMSRYLRAV